MRPAEESTYQAYVQTYSLAVTVDAIRRPVSVPRIELVGAVLLPTFCPNARNRWIDRPRDGDVWQCAT